MAARAPTAQPPTSDAERTLAALAEVREGTFALLAGLSDQQLTRVHSPMPGRARARSAPV